jgi:transcriptional regulator with XRE-family HTH domain
MTPSLARAARAILNWSMADLAKRIEVGIGTVRDYENCSRMPRKLTLLAIAGAFRDEGIEFVGGEGRLPGVLVHRPELLANPPPPRAEPEGATRGRSAVAEKPEGKPRGRKKAS